MLSNYNQQIINQLNSLGLTICTCESMTGGAVGANLVLSEHASDSYLGCLNTYSTDSKIKLAKVDKETLDKYSTVSVQCAREMADGAMKAFKADIAVSVTGNATAASSGGVAYICIKLIDKYHDFKFVSKYKDRVDIINECTAFVLNQIWELIKGLKK